MCVCVCVCVCVSVCVCVFKVVFSQVTLYKRHERYYIERVFFLIASNIIVTSSSFNSENARKRRKGKQQ